MSDRDPDIRLGDYTDRAEALVAGGNFESIDHVVEAALDALDRENCAFNEMVREKLAEARADPRPGIPMEEAFATLRAAAKVRHAG